MELVSESLPPNSALFSVPPPNLSVPPPRIQLTQDFTMPPPPSFAVPPPEIMVPPPAFTVPPPDFTVPPPDFTVPPPDFMQHHPPPGVTLPPQGSAEPPPASAVPLTEWAMSDKVQLLSNQPSAILSSRPLSVHPGKEDLPYSSQSANCTTSSGLLKRQEQLQSHTDSKNDYRPLHENSYPLRKGREGKRSSLTPNSVERSYNHSGDGSHIRRPDKTDQSEEFKKSRSRHSRQRSNSGSNTDRSSRSKQDLNNKCRKQSRLSPPARGHDRAKSMKKERMAQSLRATDNEMQLDFHSDEPTWYRSSPADLYYAPRGCGEGGGVGSVQGTPRLAKLCATFSDTLLSSAPHDDEETPPIRKPATFQADPVWSSESEGEGGAAEQARLRAHTERVAAELRRKQNHPRRLHPEIWHNEAGELNGGAACGCSARARREGVHHGVFPGEPQPQPCDPHSSNLDRLYHYRITVSPSTNFLTDNPTVIVHDGHEFVFCGFSVFTHYKLDNVPSCTFIRYKIEYTIRCEEDQAPTNFTICELNLFQQYLFLEILELVDFLKRDEDHSRYHLLPRFVRSVDGGGREILSMSEVLRYLVGSCKPLIPQHDGQFKQMDDTSWECFLVHVKGTIVQNPHKKPRALRLDHVDRPGAAGDHPPLVHFSKRPMQLCYLGNQQYQKLWRRYEKCRRGAASAPEAKRRLREAERALAGYRRRDVLKRDVTVTVSSRGFRTTGLRTDVVQHAMLIPVLVKHLRFHRCLGSLEEKLGYKFHSHSLLERALTHTSYDGGHGTNPDHARGALTNCGVRRPEYGDGRALPQLGARMKGFDCQNRLMSSAGARGERESPARHNERLEFLGDAALGLVVSLRLYGMLPERTEGALSTYRSALVQNAHLAHRAQLLGLQKYMLVGHGPELCPAGVMRHALADCLEAIIGAVYLEGGLAAADAVVATVFWGDCPEVLATWSRPREHPLSAQEPLGDRHYVHGHETLQKLTQLEEAIGVSFHHIRLLACALTDRSVGYTHLTLGSNDTMEFLGDSLLKLRVSDYLYRHFPDHQEGHLSLLQMCLVNNRTLAAVSSDLGLPAYVISSAPAHRPLLTKQKADLFEAFLAAIYIDRGMEHVEVTLKVCLYPRLRDAIADCDWSDPKSRLQQLCLSLRAHGDAEPDLPHYRVIGIHGSTDRRRYTAAVYFRDCKLAVGVGRSKLDAEMAAARATVAKWNNQSLIIPAQKPKRKGKGRGRTSSVSELSDTTSDDSTD